MMRSTSASLTILNLFSVDEIVEKNLDTPGNVYLSKIDVARTFRNVMVDPADALKFGIIWQGKYFMNKGVSFGRVHRSLAFHMRSDTITYIMPNKIHHIHFDIAADTLSSTKLEQI